MNRSPLQQQIIDYLLGRADPQTEQEIRAYIEFGGPQTVQQAHEARTALSELMQTLAPVEPDASVRTALFDRVNGAADSRPRFEHAAYADRTPDGPLRSRRIWPASIAAAIALVLLSAVAFFGIRQNIRAQRQMHVATTQQQAMDDATPISAADPGDVSSMLHAYFDLVPLHGLAPNEADRGRLLVSREHNLCFVFAPMLHASGTHGLYDLRITPREAEPFVAGQFSVDSAGWSLFRIELPEESVFATAAVVRSGTPDQSGPLQELLIGDFSR